MNGTSINEDEIRKAFELHNTRYRNIKPIEDPLGVVLAIDHDKKLIKKLNLDVNKNYVCLISICLEENWKAKQGDRKNVEGYVDFLMDKVGDGYPIVDSKKLSAKSPVRLHSIDDYSFDIKEKKFYIGNKVISLTDIVEELYRMHIKPTKKLTGFSLRWKIRLYKFLAKAILWIAELIAKIYFMIFGEKVAHDFISEYMLKHFPVKAEIKTVKVRTVSIFGYTASAHLIFFFCLFHFGFYLIVTFFGISLGKSITNILRNNFLTLSYSIIILYILEEYMNPIVKKILLRVLAKARKLHESISEMKISI